MGDEYSLKIRQWFVSVLVLLATATSSIAISSMYPNNLIPEEYRSSYGIFNSLYLYMFGLISIFWWHFFDFISKDCRKSHKKPNLAGYRVFVTLLIVRAIGITLMASGAFTTISSCGGMFVLLFQGCYGPPVVIMWPTNIISLALYSLCVVKAVSAVRSRLNQRNRPIL